MSLFKKKLTPAELKTKLAMTERKLAKRERRLKDKKEKSRGEAREALRNGDERGFRMASKRFALLNGQILAIGGMVEMSAVMLDLVEMQTGLKEVVEIGSMLKDYQDSLGIDTKQMEQAVTNLRTSMDKVNTASEMINTTMELATSGDVAVSDSQESLKAELMAEIESEKTSSGGLEDRIADARKQL